ncbi:protein Wnt-11b-2-like isoform X2 [Lineus longissimus]
MSPVAHATRLTVAACQQLFQDRRWNCSSITNAPKLPPDLTSGTREQAFVYALSAAAVAHAVARSCSTGGTTRCSCGRLPREAPDGDFKWGGCSDNTRFGAQFGKLFVDAPWTKSSKEGSNKRTKSSLNSASNSASAVPPPEVVTTATPGVRKKKRKGSHSRSKRALMNRHNNEAGRQALLLSLDKSCKCHGVSGSCSLKTCWKALPDLITVGSLIKKRYQIAVEVAKRKVGKKKMLVPIDSQRILFRADEMIYYTKSPDYCSPEKKLGSIGTHGRECKKGSEGSDGCGSMCCGRGFYSYTKLVKERCHCKYYWCCYVKCKTCTKNVEVHTCK